MRTTQRFQHRFVNAIANGENQKRWTCVVMGIYAVTGVCMTYYEMQYKPAMAIAMQKSDAN